MTICLYGSPISTFARKVAIGLELKGLPYNLVDALTPDRREQLRRLNPRLEVPVLTDGDLVIVNSSDILQYLDWRYPEQPLYPAAIEERVVARAFERLGDQRFDPIVVDCSYWSWAERDDDPPPGLVKAAQKDIDAIFDRLEQMLLSHAKPWPFQTPRRRRMRLVCEPRRIAGIWPRDRFRAFSNGHELVQDDKGTSNICRRCKAHRCIFERPQTPDARA